MTHKHRCECPDCRRLWGDPADRIRRFLRRLDRGKLAPGPVCDQEVYELDGKTVVVVRHRKTPPRNLSDSLVPGHS